MREVTVETMANPVYPPGFTKSLRTEPRFITSDGAAVETGTDAVHRQIILNLGLIGCPADAVKWIAENLPMVREAISVRVG